MKGVEMVGTSFPVVARFVGALFLLAGTASLASAQVTAGGIRGVVADPTGAVVPGADVTATNLATGQSISTQTTEAGVYVLGNIPVGDYDLSVESLGFKRYSQTGVNVATATTTIDNDSGSGANARLEINVKQTGTYHIVAYRWSGGVRNGTYTVQVTIFGTHDE